MRTNTRGFTLIELLVVVAIIGILSSVVLASLSAARLKARDARRLSDLRQIRTALELYRTDYGDFPPPGNNRFFGGNDPETSLAPYIGSIGDPSWAGDTTNDYRYGSNSGGAALRIQFEGRGWCSWRSGTYNPWNTDPDCPGS